MADPTQEEAPEQKAVGAPSELETTAMTAVADLGEQPRIQFMTAVDGFGLPFVFASLFCYIIMGAGKPFIHDWLSKKGQSLAWRKNVMTSTSVFPGMLSALIVDFSPIAAAIGVELTWWQAIPVGGFFYGAGAVVIYRIQKRFFSKYDPMEWFLGRLGMRPKKERQAQQAEAYAEVTGMLNVKALQEAVDAKNAKDAEKEKSDG